MSNQCTQIRVQISCFLDSELHSAEYKEIEAHLNECPDCKNFLDKERELLNSIRAFQPLYSAPETLRLNIQKTLNSTPKTYVASKPFRQRIERLIQVPPAYSGYRSAIKVSAFLIVMFALILTLILALKQGKNSTNSPSEFAILAVDTHQRRMQNRLPLEITSESPENISSWFKNKLPFNFKLPNYQEISGQEKLYSLEGARLVAFNKDYAAYVAYRMGQQLISLIVTSESSVKPRGGQVINSKGLKFHLNVVNGYKVITWSDRGLTYALVSDLEQHGQKSCMVCHAGSKDFTEIFSK